MRNGRRLYEALRQKFEPEAVKIAAELSIRLRERGDGILWKRRPLPKQKR
jgi:hypothetical protein